MKDQSKGEREEGIRDGKEGPGEEQKDVGKG